MAKGFFHKSTITNRAPADTLLPKCGACGLYKRCSSPKLPVRGKGEKRILIVGDFPTEMDDINGKMLSGSEGKLLASMLKEYGVEMIRDCWITSALICHPRKKKEDDSKNDVKRIEFCRPNILRAIKEYNPTLIILLGQQACKSVLGFLWGSDVGPLSRWEGWTIPSQTWNAWVCPMSHPSQLLKEKRNKKPNLVLEVIFKRHLRTAVEISKERPWVEVPDYRGQVEILLDEKQTGKAIKEFIEEGGVGAIDLECNMLKPDSNVSKIVSCSICHRGQRTIAYPWTKATAAMTRAYLRSPSTKKIASNMKYEDRWFRRFLKTSVQGWVWDTMLAAHMINNQEGTASVKFQAFVLLGLPPYNEHISPYLRSSGSSSYSENQIHEIELTELLIYNGLDSLVEYHVAKQQRKIFK